MFLGLRRQGVFLGDSARRQPLQTRACSAAAPAQPGGSGKCRTRRRRSAPVALAQLCRAPGHTTKQGGGGDRGYCTRPRRPERRSCLQPRSAALRAPGASLWLQGNPGSTRDPAGEKRMWCRRQSHQPAPSRLVTGAQTDRRAVVYRRDRKSVV